MGNRDLCFTTTWLWLRPDWSACGWFWAAVIPAHIGDYIQSDMMHLCSFSPFTTVILAHRRSLNHSTDWSHSDFIKLWIGFRDGKCSSTIPLNLHNRYIVIFSKKNLGKILNFISLDWNTHHEDNYQCGMKSCLVLSQPEVAST